MYEQLTACSVCPPRMLFALAGDSWPPQEVSLPPGTPPQLPAALVSLLLCRLSGLQAGQSKQRRPRSPFRGLIVTLWGVHLKCYLHTYSILRTRLCALYVLHMIASSHCLHAPLHFVWFCGMDLLRLWHIFTSWTVFFIPADIYQTKKYEKLSSSLPGFTALN